MEYNSKDLARYFIAYANNSNPKVEMGGIKVQKLMYIAYGVCLASDNGRLTDEHPQAWPYGPVFAKTHKPIARLLASGTASSLSVNDSEFAAFQNDKNLQDILKIVFETFGHWAASSLVEWSHRKGGAWDVTISDTHKWGTEMDDGIIKSVFTELLS